MHTPHLRRLRGLKVGCFSIAKPLSVHLPHNNMLNIANIDCKCIEYGLKKASLAYIASALLDLGFLNLPTLGHISVVRHCNIVLWLRGLYFLCRIYKKYLVVCTSPTVAIFCLLLTNCRLFEPFRLQSMMGLIRWVILRFTELVSREIYPSWLAISRSKTAF